MPTKIRQRTRGFTLVEIMTTVAIIGILASMAMPAFSKYVRRSRTSEALMNLRKMYDASVEYFARDYADRTGRLSRHRFPGKVPLTPPATDFCRNGVKFKPDTALWEHATWEALSFAMSDPHYYAYQYVSEGLDKTATFTARAVGDLNCNGFFSTFERIGTVDSGLNVVGGGGIYTMFELE